MSMTSCRAVALAGLACATMLTACDDAPKAQQGASPAAASAKPAGPKYAHLSTEMVAAVSSGKTATAIGVHFVLGAVPTVGKALPVKIAIVPHRDFVSLRAHFETHDGLTLTAGENFGPVTGADAEAALQHDLVLLPGKEGVFMVTISVDTDGEEGNFTRVFTIPVIVGMNQREPPVPAPASATPSQPAAN